MKKINGYLREEFPGEFDSNSMLEKTKEKTSIKDLKSQGLSDEEIKKLIIEAE